MFPFKLLLWGCEGSLLHRLLDGESEKDSPHKFCMKDDVPGCKLQDIKRKEALGSQIVSNLKQNN
jgi:hypothetical protein